VESAEEATATVSNTLFNIGVHEITLEAFLSVKIQLRLDRKRNVLAKYQLSNPWVGAQVSPVKKKPHGDGDFVTIKGK